MSMREFPELKCLVPHRPPMVLVDEVIADSEQGTTCRVTIREDSPFVDDGSIPSYVAFEHMAQSVAAHAGLRDYRAGREIQIGFIIGLRHCEFFVDRFWVGDELLVHVEHVWGDGALGQFNVTVESAGQRVAVGQMSVYQGQLEEQA